MKLTCEQHQTELTVTQARDDTWNLTGTACPCTTEYLATHDSIRTHPGYHVTLLDQRQAAHTEHSTAISHANR